MAEIRPYFDEVSAKINSLECKIRDCKEKLDSNNLKGASPEALRFEMSRLSGRLEEMRLYKIIQQELPQDWKVLYDLNFAAGNGRGILTPAQIDFLVIVPGLGVINLECKGRYYWDGAHFFTAKGASEPVDLVGQCFDADKLFRNFCVERTGLPWSKLGVYSHLLVFPSYDYKGIDFCGTPAIDGPRLSQKGALEKRIRDELVGKKLQFHVDFPAQSSSLVWDVLTQDCTPDEMHSNVVPLDRMLEEMDQTTGDKAEDILDSILEDETTNWKILGSAGTGKTMIAEAFARRYLSEHPARKVLFLCYNKLLSAYLNLRNGGKVSGLTISNVHDLFSAKVGGSEDMAVPMNKIKPFSFQSNFDSREDIALKMIESTDYRALSDRRYDCVIIDEAQDFCRNDFIYVNSLLKQTRKIVLFQSSEQKVYSGGALFEDSWMGTEPFKTKVLRHNLRNSKMIHKYCAEISHDTTTKSRVRYEGVYPEVEKTRSITDIYLAAIKEGFHNENIAILTDCGLETLAAPGITLLKPSGEKVKELIKKLKEWRKGNGVWCGGLKGFKCLEAEFVIVVLSNPSTDWKDVYVACTRAKYRLVIRPGDTNIRVDLPASLACCA